MCGATVARNREQIASERRIAAAERQRAALALRKAGHDYDEIAARLGYRGRSGAYQAVMTALKRTVQEPSEDVRRLEVARLDALLAGLWDAACAGKWLAVDRVLSIMARRAALLGLDAPAKSEETVHVLVSSLAERAAVAAGLDPALVIAEAERILAESVA